MAVVWGIICRTLVGGRHANQGRVGLTGQADWRKARESATGVEGWEYLSAQNRMMWVSVDAMEHVDVAAKGAGAQELEGMSLRRLVCGGGAGIGKGVLQPTAVAQDAWKGCEGCACACCMRRKKRMAMDKEDREKPRIREDYSLPFP